MIDKTKPVKLSAKERVALNRLASYLAENFDDEPTQQFANVLAALCVADFAGFLGELNAIADQINAFMAQEFWQKNEGLTEDDSDG